MSPPVVTRFAPSPTGYLHIGGARTALFNWLYAKANGGQMLLRIEDTDRDRYSDEAVEAILDGLTWLGLDWSGDAFSQYAHGERHREIALQLLAEGKAYKCYCSPGELTAMREAARAEGRPIRYDGTWRDRDEAEAPDGIAPVIRFKAPQDGETVVDDQVQGRVVYQNKELDDLIILRSDGSPTYNLSVVVDDHDMGVTHIVRGVDHLTNAARQSQIYLALGWQVPVMVHIPLIHGPDGAKLSKRHGALGVDAYRAMGYLPDAMRNYLARLGWSHGDDEVFSTEQMIEWFSLDAIGKAPARFDFAKLENLNGIYIRNTADDELADAIDSFLPYSEMDAATVAKFHAGREQLIGALAGLKARARTMIELVNGAAFLFAERPLKLDEKAAGILNDGGREVLGQLIGELDNQADWTTEALEEKVKAFAEAQDIKLGKIAQPLRAALTGTTVSPGIFDVLVVLGRDESLGRIRDNIS
ncbi:MAG: glutamate--tRNA ligase [Rhizobiales bacterium]|nr:glutamate--tRNA ligase [Hyphomicrobiales bacterium]